MARLLVISAMPHHKRDGVVVGWGATVRELDRLATRFDTVRHIACLSTGEAPASALPYSAPNIELVPVSPAGADGLLGKLDVLRRIPEYVAAILRELPRCDVVHVRAPANVALVAALVLVAARRPRARWIKYAGNWRPDERESPSYTLQRRLLGSGATRSFVTVNGEWKGDPRWVRRFENPSLDATDLAEGRRSSEGKRIGEPVELLYVGRVETPKGAGRAIEILAELTRRGIKARLRLIGDGSERAAFEQLARTLELADRVQFDGWRAPDDVKQAYAAAHILLLPTFASEGWPKVLSEGMAFGVVPVAGAVSSIPYYLRLFGCGRALDPRDISGFADAIESYVRAPASWATESRAALEAAHMFTFDHYLSLVDRLLADLGVRA